jgi:Asparagine synthase (glutamine-hydrolyzing)
MCGFVGAFDLIQDISVLRGQVLRMAKKIRHRGPDWSGIYCGEKSILAHERLSIVGVDSGKQPLYSKDGNLVWLSMVRLYNRQRIRSRYPDYEFLTHSDCEVILALYKDKGVDLFEDLNGIFAFALYDVEMIFVLLGVTIWG